MLGLDVSAQVSNVGLADNRQINVVISLTALRQIEDQIGVDISDYQLTLIDVRDDCVLVGVALDLDLVTGLNSDNDLTVQVGVSCSVVLLGELDQFRWT